MISYFVKTLTFRTHLRQKISWHISFLFSFLCIALLEVSSPWAIKVKAFLSYICYLCNSIYFISHQKTITADKGWAGRFWGETGCNGDACDPGPNTLAEFNIGDMDFYDVSLVDGFNMAILVSLFLLQKYSHKQTYHLI